MGLARPKGASDLGDEHRLKLPRRLMLPLLGGKLRVAVLELLRAEKGDGLREKGLDIPVLACDERLRLLKNLEDGAHRPL